MSSSSPQLPLGQVIGSRYRVQSLIGRGGMGMVYAATHELTGRRVALKLMLSDSEDAPVLQERFLSEARIAATVRHPNIVDVLDMGLHNGAPYLVMELLEGMSLERLLQDQSRLSAEQALAWLLPVIGALSVLHEAGIVHRDVKPSNIFLSTLPRHPMRPKLLDFGLARVVSDLRLTRSGTVIGTPLYMAPEHAAGLATGPQADIWSIGVVIYEVLTGGSPFQYTDRASLAAQVLAGLVRPLREVRPDLPELMSVAIMRALQRDLTRRYPDMRSLARALHAAAVASGITVPADPDPIGLPDYARWNSADAIANTTHEHPSGSRPQPAASAGWPTTSNVDAMSMRPRRRGLWVSMALAACLIAALAVWLMQRQDVQPVARPEPVQLREPRAPSASFKPTVEPIAPSAQPARSDEQPAAPGSKDSASSARPPTTTSTRRSVRSIRRGSSSEAPVAPAPAARKSQQDEVESEWK
jgi:serine/threonine protein kinase